MVLLSVVVMAAAAVVGFDDRESGCRTDEASVSMNLQSICPSSKLWHTHFCFFS
jgi:hypothetical protein